MKKLFSLLALGLISTFCLTGCNDSVSTSLDKNDVTLKNLLDIEFTKVISYNEYSKYCAYDAINKAFANAKFRISFIGSGMNLSANAIASVDAKTGERIGACKATLGNTYGAISGLTGKQMTYIRGSKSYSEFNFTLFYQDIVNGTGKHTTQYAGKFYMDIPAKDEKGVGSFFGNNAAENPEFVSPYFFIDTLKENGLISDNETVIKKARSEGIDYYRVEFTTSFLDPLGIQECEFTLAMNGKKVYGMAIEVKYTMDGKTSFYSTVHMRPFTGTYKDVPTSFSGYDMSYEEYLNGIAEAAKKM